MALTGTGNVVVERAPAVATRHRERRWLGWIDPQPNSSGALVARLGLGIVFLMHGLQKLGLFGGAGWSGTIGFFQQQLHIPPALGALAILTEVVGGALLIIGLAARLVAIAAIIHMVVAASMVHVKNGFFINWNMQPGVGHGFEMNLALIALAAVVLVEGAGRLALDRRIAHSLALRATGGSTAVLSETPAPGVPRSNL